VNRQDHSKPVVPGPTEDSSIHGCERDRCWVVIPAYNEAATVREVAMRSRQQCAQVIVVDDGSTDNTAESLAARVLTQEHLIYPRAIAALLPAL